MTLNEFKKRLRTVEQVGLLYDPKAPAIWIPKTQAIIWVLGCFDLDHTPKVDFTDHTCWIADADGEEVTK